MGALGLCTLCVANVVKKKLQARSSVDMEEGEIPCLLLRPSAPTDVVVDSQTPSRAETKMLCSGSYARTVG